MKRLALVLFLSLQVFGQTWSGIIAPERAVDWTQAGIPGGIPTGWANCVTSACNTLNAGTVTSASINAAILSAPNQTVVRIPAGTFTVSGFISTDRSNIVLRGAGPTQTKLTMSTGNIFFGATGAGGSRLGGEPGLSASNWTAGLTRGSTVITLASTSGLSAGQQIGLDQLNDASIVFTLGSDGTLPGVNRNGTTNFDGNMTRTQHQIVEIKAVCTGNNVPAGFGCTTANQLAVDPPVDYTHQIGLTPQAYWWSPRSTQFVGLENIKIDANAGDFAVTFAFCSYCWTKNIEVDNGRHSEIRAYFNYKSEFRDSYINEPDLGGGPTQYGIEIADSTLVKVENNIIFNVTSGILPATSSQIVVGYNFALNITSGNQFNDFESHGVHNYLHLYEGNSVNGLIADNVWGSMSQTTYFRNRSTGDAPNKTNFRDPMSMSAHQRYLNVLGNVFGTAGYHTVYQKDDTNQNGPDNFIYQVGFFNRWDFNQNPYDSVTKTSLMRWGNWDSVNNATRFVNGEVPTADPTFPNAVPASQTLPASFYLSSKPAWFGTVAWPPIGPDVTCTVGCITNVANHAAKIPAQLCYENTAKSGAGYLTAFDAATCYAASAGPAASFSPSSLTFTGQLLNTTSTGQAITLTNTGSSNLTISSITLSGVNSGDFAQTNNCPGTLSTGLNCTINVTFTPLASGSRSANVSVADDAAGSPQTVGLSGTGVAPTPTAILSAASISFSNQTVGTTSGSQTISLSNTGTATLSIASIVVNGDFSRTTTCGATLGVGLSCNISVTFTPTVAGLRNGTLTVTDNSGGVAGSTQTASLSGTGISSIKVSNLGRVSSGRSFAFGRQGGMIPDFMAFLPVLWVNTGITTNDGICSSAPGGVYDVDKTLGVDFTADMSGLGAAFTEWLGNPDQWYRLKIPPGTNIHGSSYNGDNALISTPKKAGATKCLVVESTVPLPKNRIVCSHGLPGYGGTRNPGCTTDIGQMWKLVADSTPSSGNNNINFPVGSNHIVIRDAEITIAKGSAQSSNGVKVNVVAELRGDHIGIERSYIHGYDPGDQGQPANVCTNNAAPGVSGGWRMTGKVNTSGTSVTWVSDVSSGSEKSKRFGMSFSDGVHSAGFPQAIITINGVDYTIGSHDPLASDTTLTLTTSAGTQANVSYSLTNPMTGYEHGCGDDNRGVLINCDYCWLAYNYFEKIHWYGSESHVISSGFSNGPIKVVHNWVEPGSAGYFSGGGAANTRGGPTSNFEIRGNIFARDLNYRFLSASASQSPAPPFGCGPFDNTSSSDNCPLNWGIKNNIEFKTGSKFLIDGNMIDGVWADGQTGYLMLLTVKQDGGGYDPVTGLPLGRLEDGRISNNWFRNGPQMVQLISRSLGHGNGNGISNPLQRLDFINNIFTNIGDSEQWGSPGNDIMQIPASNQTYLSTMSRVGGAAHAVAIPPRLTNYASGQNGGNYPSVFDFSSITSVADMVTADLGEQLDPKIGGTITIANKPGWNGTFTITGVKFGNVTTPCTTGINQANVSDPTYATQPQPCIVSTGINAGTFGDTIIYTDNINHPGTATLCSSVPTCKTSVSGIQASIDTHWFRITDMSVGDGVFVRNCAGGTNPTAFQVGANSLVLAIAPTNPAGLDVYYANPGADDSSGTTCLLENGNGLPKSLNFSNNTFLSQKIMSLGIGPGVNAQTFNMHTQHNVFGMPSGNNAVLACSTIGSQGTVLGGPGSCADQNTFQFNDNIMALRTLGQWPPIPATATPNVTPATIECSGATANTTCLGLTGYMNGVTFPLTPCTYDGTNAMNCPLMAAPWSNNFSLSKLVPVATSPFFTEGANIPALENAFTRTKYVCPVGANCGTGPFSD